MWERALSTAGTENEGRAGTTLRIGSESCGCEAEVWCDAGSSRLRLSMVSGDYVYQSDWLAASPLLERAVMDQLLLEGLKRWHLLVSSPYSKQTPGWTPLALTTLLFSQIDHVLA